MSNEINLAPIVLFVFNRPQHTRLVVEGLLDNPEASNSDLFIFADGPRVNESVESRKKIVEVRKYIHTIKGFRNIVIEEADKNRGLAPSTIYGISKVINEYGKVIMIEDDDIPNRYFLNYVNTCLNIYENDKRIWCVSGYINTNDVPPYEDEKELFLVRRPSSWGFGTWKRCWDKIIWDINTLRGIFSHKDVFHGYNEWAGIDSSRIMRDLFEGKSSSWSIRYNFAAYLNKALTILPNKTYIINSGLDGSGTHCGDNQVGNLIQMDHLNLDYYNIEFNRDKNKKLLDSFKPKGIRNIYHFYISDYPLLKSVIYKILGKKIPEARFKGQIE